MNFVSKVALSGVLAFALVLFFSPMSLSQASYSMDWSNDVNFGLTGYNTKICFDNIDVSSNYMWGAILCFIEWFL